MSRDPMCMRRSVKVDISMSVDMILETARWRNAVEPTQSPVFAAIAEPTRREILLVLAGGELSVGEIAEKISNLGRTTISSHLRVLRMARLVKERRDGRFRYYSVDPAPAAQLVEFVTAVYRDSLYQLESVISDPMFGSDSDALPSAGSETHTG